ncbi:pollen receptor-like kinase 3 [Phragmites australis]|uniref:pollen receptor-like kinase 3 n=1 Tax=Phragmites australis TaxID=29695 RepID=UPI002D766645|nr:pollen receptor-like kinase 3 [Phragmites australis]
MVTLLLAFRLSPLLLLLLTALVVAADDGGTDAAALLRLKESFSDPTGALEAWSASSPSVPCDETDPWPGVQCYNGVLVGLRLAHMNLSGTFDFAALAHLPGLHSVNLKRNNFSGPLPASLATVRSLRALYLSYNSFSGSVPGDVLTNMRWLKKLYLDNNNLTGPLPADAIADAPRLLELHLENNRIEGPVPPFLPASLRLFNVSHNSLTGVIPTGVAARYNASAFAGNPGLCGAQGSDPDACAAEPAPEPMPPPTPADYLAVEKETSVVVVIGIILLVILLVTGAMVLMLRQDERNSRSPAWDYPGASAGSGKAVVASTGPQAAEMVAVDVAGGSSSHGGSRGGRRMGEFVLMSEDSVAFGLPELMKASAEVLGNGTLGSAYKAAMRNGVTVAVKRMRDMNRVGRDEFEQHLLMLGELRHPNVLPPIGYHYRKEEKLIVSEYMPRGSLLYVLHGDQSPNRVILDWPARMRVAVGVARGMAFLHETLGIPAGRLVSMDGADFDAPPPPPPHGNLKSGNILLDVDLEPRLVDYGFFPLVNSAQAPQAMFAFRSPEGATRGVVSARSDVYCLGVVLLELVTGRFPSQYLLSARGGTDVVHWSAAAVAEGGERELVDPAVAAGGGDAAVRLLRVGVHCASAEPECRPSMAEAAWMVEEIAAAGAS